jgi:hypothetical protein
MYNTQSASSATSASTSSVASTPVTVSVSAITPASTPILSAPYTRRPTTSRSGWRIDAASARWPMLPVAHWMTRYDIPLPLSRTASRGRSIAVGLVP